MQNWICISTGVHIFIGKESGKKQVILSYQRKVGKDQQFIICHLSRQSFGKNGEAKLNTASLTCLWKKADIDGEKYKPVAALTRTGGSALQSAHFTFQCRRGDSGDWYNISDAMKPIRINEPVVSFLYLLMKDAPPMY